MKKLLAFAVIHQVEYTIHQQSALMVAGFIQQEVRQCVIYVKVAGALSVLRQRAKAYSSLVAKR
jgi:hypothetical protein